MAAATARETSDACKGKLRLHLPGHGLLRDLAFPVTRRVGPTGEVGLGRKPTWRSGPYFMSKTSSAVLPRIIWAFFTVVASNTAWMALRV